MSGPPPVPGGRSRGEREAARRARTSRRKGEKAPRAPRPPRDRRGSPRVAAALAGGLAVVVAGWFLLSLFQPFRGEGDGQVRVLIPKGAGVGRIADLLEQNGVISSSFFFEARATVSRRRDDLKPGSYRLKRDMSNGAALDALAEGPPPDIVTLTIPEGRSRREIARIVGRSLRGDYLAATRRSSALDPARYGAERAPSLEGFLFPATYELKRGRPVSALVEQQLAAFERRFAEVDLRYARRKNLTAYDVLIIASMVERETRVAQERPLVASVIYNRLSDDMPLGIDSTIRFATGNWTRPITASDLRSASAYNTRNRSGLPPTPIGNPGLASIRAAARPARSRFRYFVVKPGTCGEHDFSVTDAEHNRKAARYNRERQERGGRSPTEC